MRPLSLFLSTGAVAVLGIAALGVDALARRPSPTAPAVRRAVGSLPAVSAESRPVAVLTAPLSSPAVSSPRGPGAAAARPSPDPEVEPPVDEDEAVANQDQLERDWAGQPRDEAWADVVERRIIGLFASERVAPDFEKTVECRSTLCKMDIATTAMMQLENLGNVQRALGDLTIFTEVRSDGNAHLVAYTEASGSLPRSR